MSGQGSCVSNYEELRARQKISEILEFPQDKLPESEEIVKKIKRWIILMQNSWPGGADLGYQVDRKLRLIRSHVIVGRFQKYPKGQTDRMIQDRYPLMEILDMTGLMRGLVSYYKVTPFFRREIDDAVEMYGIE